MFDVNGQNMGIVSEEIAANFLGSIVNANVLLNPKNGTGAGKNTRRRLQRTIRR
jgi:hypothetical protein